MRNGKEKKMTSATDYQELKKQIFSTEINEFED